MKHKIHYTTSGELDPGELGESSGTTSVSYKSIPILERHIVKRGMLFKYRLKYIGGLIF